METRARSLAKAAVWRVVSIVVLVTISYFFTGDVKKTTWITIVFQIILAIAYYVHERVWARVSWGRITKET